MLTHSGGPLDGLLLTYVQFTTEDEGRKTNVRKFMRDLKKVPKTAWIHVNLEPGGIDGVGDVIHALSDEGYAIMVTDNGDSRPQFLDKVAWRESFTLEPVGKVNVLRIGLPGIRESGVPNLGVPVVIHCSTKEMVIEAAEHAKQNPFVRVLRVSESGTPRSTVMINMEGDDE
jgi:hypothetical protein